MICGINCLPHLNVTGAGFEYFFHFKTTIMNSNKILTSDLLDILFDQRNKEYGAYALRKFYPGRVKTSLLIMLGMAGIFSAFTLLPAKEKVDDLITYVEGPTLSNIEPVKKVQEPPRQKQTALAVPSQKFISNMKFVDEKDSADKFHDLDNLRIGSVTNIVEGPPSDIDPGPPTAYEPPKPAAPEPVGNAVENNPDVQASYPGGEAALINFLQRNLHAPQELEEGETIQVRIRYLVGFDGNLQGFDVVQDGGTVFNNEVIRVLKKMPKWNPGKKGGRNVLVYYTLPVKFTAAE